MTLGRTVLGARFPIVLAIVALMSFCLPGLFRLNVTVEISEYLLEDDPVLKADREFRSLFALHDFVGVLVESDDVFSRESLELITRIGRRLAETFPQAEPVISISSLPDALAGGTALVFDRDTLISTDRELEDLRQALAARPSLEGSLFSSDYRQAWVILPLTEDLSAKPGVGADSSMFTTGKIAWEAIQSIDSGGVRITATGMPVHAYRKKVEMLEDLTWVLAIGAVVATALSLLILRSVSGVVGTLGVFVVSVTTVLGIQGWLHTSVDSGFLAVPILLTMGVSIGYTIHIHRFFVIRLRKTEDREAAIAFALAVTRRPILFTAFTTIVALMSFLLVEIKPIRWVGLTSALCILIAFALSLSLFPIILSLGRKRGHRKGRDRRDLLGLALQNVAGKILMHERWILLVFVAVVGVAVYGVTRLQIDFDAERMMGTRFPHMADQARISDSQIARSESLSLVIRVPARSFNEIELVTLLDSLEQRLATEDLVKRTRSLTGVVQEVNFAIHGSNREYYRIPSTQVALRALLRLVARLRPDEQEKWVTDDYASAHILIELKTFSSLAIEDLVDKIDLWVAELFPRGTDHFVSGMTYQMALMNQYVTRGLVRSILMALITITTLMILVFRSVKIGLVAMIPNVVPVLVAGGFMGLTGIRLEFVTMTIAPIILGLAVDDTIHLMVYLRAELERTGDFAKSLHSAFFHVGTAITETTIILCLSFLVFTVSRMNSIIYMGVIACVGLLCAYLLDLFVTPILVRRLKLHR